MLLFVLEQILERHTYLLQNNEDVIMIIISFVLSNKKLTQGSYSQIF